MSIFRVTVLASMAISAAAQGSRVGTPCWKACKASGPCASCGANGACCGLGDGGICEGLAAYRSFWERSTGGSHICVALPEPKRTGIDELVTIVAYLCRLTFILLGVVISIAIPTVCLSGEAFGRSFKRHMNEMLESSAGEMLKPPRPVGGRNEIGDVIAEFIMAIIMVCVAPIVLAPLTLAFAPICFVVALFEASLPVFLVCCAAHAYTWWTHPVWWMGLMLKASGGVFFFSS